MLSIGVAGESPQNGHPFSFSAIFNGFDSDKIRAAGWGLIADYLNSGMPQQIGGLGARVTHVWFPDRDRANLLSEATEVDFVSDSFDEMVAEVDAVMILRDDWESNLDMALSSLRLGKPTFVDKPLSLSSADLDVFEPYLRSGLLMTGSGLRFSPELANVWMKSSLGRARDKPMTIVASGPGDWEHNSMHLLEPSFVLAKTLGLSPVEQGLFSVSGTIGFGPDNHGSFVPNALNEQDIKSEADKKLFFSAERLVLVMELRNAAQNPPFQLECDVGGGVRVAVRLQNRLAAFRELLSAFVATASSGVAVVDPEETMWCLRRAEEGQKWITGFTE